MITEYTKLKKSSSQQLNITRGFSLIELIVVIVILGVLATGISTFISFGTQVYTDATDREKVVSSARFAIERLNRELRNVLPNSLCLTNTTNGICDENATQCLKFTPIIEATTYLDIPVAPDDPLDRIKVIKFTEEFDADWNVIVYPLTPADVYGSTGKKFPVLKEINTDDTRDDWEIELEDEIHFAEHSPTQRIFFTKGSVSYCLNLISGELLREDVLMAENITNSDPFTIENPSLQRNSIVQVVLTFTKNNEEITFNNEIQVPNVP